MIKPRKYARVKLLGSQWFMGRTGFDNLRKESNEEEKANELNDEQIK